MNRRELLKPLAALVPAALFVKGEKIGNVFKFEKEAKYAVFIDARMLNGYELTGSLPLPAGTPIYPVRTVGQESIDDAIRIYKLED